MPATEIPADRGNWGTGAALGEETNRRLVALIEAAAKNRAATPAERIAADFHTAYMDAPGIAARGLAPLRPFLSRIAAMKDKTPLARTLGERLRAELCP